MSGGLEVTGLVVRGPGAGPTDGPDPGEVDLELRPGELVALSTLDAVDASVLLGALAGLRPTYAGTVLLDGEPLLSRDGSAPPVRLGYVGPDHLLLGTLTAVENLAVVLLGTGASAAEVVARATSQLDAVGLPPSSWHNLVEQLSGGQQQRVAVARALVARPRLLLLDDPTSELDPASAELVALALGEAAAAGAVVVVGTDDPVLLDVCDEVTLDGQVTPTYAPRRALL